jgi:hypothetical protein
MNTGRATGAKPYGALCALIDADTDLSIAARTKPGVKETFQASDYRLRIPALFVSRENHADVVESVDTRDLKQI